MIDLSNDTIKLLSDYKTLDSIQLKKIVYKNLFQNISDSKKLINYTMVKGLSNEFAKSTEEEVIEIQKILLGNDLVNRLSKIYKDATEKLKSDDISLHKFIEDQIIENQIDLIKEIKNEEFKEIEKSTQMIEESIDGNNVMELNQNLNNINDDINFINSNPGKLSGEPSN